MKASSKNKDEQSRYAHSSQGSQTSIDRKRIRRGPHVTIAVQEDEPRPSTASKSQPSPREPSITLPKPPQNTLVVRPPSPAPTPVVAIVKVDSKLDQENIHAEPAQSTTLVDPTACAKSVQEDHLVSTQSQSGVVTVEALPPPSSRPSQAQDETKGESFHDEEVRPALLRPILPEHERSKTLPSRFSVGDYQQSLASSLTSSDPSPSVIKISTASERAEYDRIVKVFYRQQASRIPIPTTWRSSAPRAYLFRGPSSPYHDVVTSPSTSRGRDVFPVTPRFATEPRRPNVGPCATASSHDAALALQDIATRPVVRFPAQSPQSAGEEIDSDSEPPGSSSNPAELPGSEVSSPPIPPRHPTRRMSNGLYRPHGSVTEEAVEDTPRRRKRRLDMDQLSPPTVSNGSSSRSAVPTPSDIDYSSLTEILGESPRRRAIPISPAPRRGSMPTHLNVPKTVPQAQPTRPASETPSATAGARSRRFQTIGNSHRVRFLEPVTLDEGNFISAAEGSSVPVQSTDWAEISRRAAALITRTRAQLQVQAPMQARNDEEGSVISADDEIWYDASNVAVVDEQMR
jgi:hypothetical protein